MSELVSLVDLLPTFNGLATRGQWRQSTEKLDGTDLTALFDQSAQACERTVYAEYLAEATTVPLFMIRRKNLKFISSSTDPNLLFDLEADPSELQNLAYEPEYADVVKQFDTEVASKWDEPALSKQIILSQQRRAIIREAVKSGTEIRWNHDELPGQEVPWYRGVGGYNEWAFDYLPVDTQRST